MKYSSLLDGVASLLQGGANNVTQGSQNLAHQTSLTIQELSNLADQASKSLVQGADALAHQTQEGIERLSQLADEVSNNLYQGAVGLAEETRKAWFGYFLTDADRPQQDPCHAKLLSQFADACYNKYSDNGKSYCQVVDGKETRQSIPSGWTVAQSYHNFLLTGLEATLYTDGTNYILAYRGTDDVRSGEADLNNGLFGLSARYVAAAILALQVKSQHPNVELTGHSLGGGEADYASAMSGAPATTFNGASPGLLNYLSGAGWIPRSNIMNYRNPIDVLSQGNLLTDLLSTKPIGTTLWVPGAGDDSRRKFLGVWNHDIQPLRDALGELGGCQSTGSALDTQLPPTSSGSSGTQGVGPGNDSSISSPGQEAGSTSQKGTARNKSTLPLSK
jgi:predicted alpha/beta hydrolase